MPRVDPATLEHLDEHGYCTVPAVVDEATAAQVRAMMDEFLGPACDHIDFVGRGMQKGTMWPERTAAEGGGPLLTEEGPYMHSLQHPIPDLDVRGSRCEVRGARWGVSNVCCRG